MVCKLKHYVIKAFLKVCFLQGLRDQNTGPKNVNVEVLLRLQNEQNFNPNPEKTFPEKHFTC